MLELYLRKENITTTEQKSSSWVFFVTLRMVHFDPQNCEAGFLISIKKGSYDSHLQNHREYPNFLSLELFLSPEQCSDL